MVVAHLVGCPSVAPHVAGSEHVAHPTQFSGAKLLLRMLLGAQPKAQTLVFEPPEKRHSATLRPHGLAYISEGRCELISKRKNAYKSFGELRQHLASLKVKDAVIDGELVCLDSEGRSIFKLRPSKTRSSN